MEKQYYERNYNFTGEERTLGRPMRMWKNPAGTDVKETGSESGH